MSHTIKEEVFIAYYAQRIGEEDYKITSESFRQRGIYNTDGKCISREFQDLDDSEYFFNESITYEEYTPTEGDHGEDRKNRVIETHNSDGYVCTKEYEDGLLVRIVEQYDDVMLTTEYDYDDNGRVVSEERFGRDINEEHNNHSLTWYEYNEDGRLVCTREVLDEGGDEEKISYELCEYFYEDDRLVKEICYACEASSPNDFLEGENTKLSVTRSFEFKEEEKQLDDKRVTTFRRYDALENTIFRKTISRYALSDNRLLSKTEILYPNQGPDVKVYETKYEYWEK